MRGRVIRFSPRGTPRGRVLMSYITLPFLNKDERVLGAHTNRWESISMVQAFLERGFSVDLIDITNTTFLPHTTYNYFIDNYHNMERLTCLLGPNCRKILHATTDHWQFYNRAEQERCNQFFKRRGIHVKPERPLPPNTALELCDEITLLGNTATAETYAYAHKKITPIPISTTHMFEMPKYKDIELVRKNFVWLGGAGVIHKGLDLVIEALAQMPEYTLTICGKLDGEKHFKKIYEKELGLPNIRIAGFVDPGSEEFKKICNENIALVYPSCSEGQSGGVILTMHAGLIPIISRESGVDTNDFGVTLKKNSIEEIKEEVRKLSSLSQEQLRSRIYHTWQYARNHHTRETFKQAYGSFVDDLIKRYST